MSNPWFFLSYARVDKDSYLDDFFKDLVDEIRLNVSNSPADEIGFFDTLNIEPGDDWPSELGNALQSARVLVSLYTPNYFTRKYCGKEWQVFRFRQEEYLRPKPPGTPLPPLIIPVLWGQERHLRDGIPAIVSRLQFNHRDFGERYATEGLRYLMKFKVHRDEYMYFVTKLASRIIDVANAHQVPSLLTLPDIKDVPSAFDSVPDITTVPSTFDLVDARQSRPGPRYVRFIFVAGRQDELNNIRNDVAAYGPKGGRDWRPYYPDLDDEMGILAQDVLAALDVPTNQRLHYEVVPPSNIIDQISEAQAQNNIVVIVVDRWSLKLDAYRSPMTLYDGRSFMNCVVLVPWNPKDPETEINRGPLLAYLNETFPTKISLPDPYLITDRIDSPETLKRELGESLLRVRDRIVKFGDVGKPVGRTMSQPTISAVQGN